MEYGKVLSVVIPDYHDPLLIKTIESLLSASELGDRLEVIAVFDGYWPDFKLVIDPRVRYVHLGKNRGMREAINAGVSVAQGKFLMRTDEHCLFGQGYDRIMTGDCRPDWIMTATRYFLDPKKWAVMEEIPPVYHEKLVIQGGEKFAGVRWPERDEELKDKMITQTMSMQGSMWLMPHDWWNKVVVELQTEGYGPLIQDSHEMIFKTWKAGGKMVLNKNTWYAHKHRSFSRTHNNGTKENPANCNAGYAYALSVWRDYYEKEIAPNWKLAETPTKVETAGEPVLLHVGCANCYTEGFDNSDKRTEWKGKPFKLDRVLDIGQPWPYKDNSVDGIVSMHVLQQLSWRELVVALREAYRVLKPGGVMRFGCPMVEIEDKDLDYLLGWNNINLFSADLLKRVMVDRIGFKQLRERGYRRSRLPKLATLDNRPNRGTKYYEVVK